MVQAGFTNAHLISNICVAEAIEAALLHQALRACKYPFPHFHGKTLIYLVIGCQYKT